MKREPYFNTHDKWQLIATLWIYNPQKNIHKEWPIVLGEHLVLVRVRGGFTIGMEQGN